MDCFSNGAPPSAVLCLPLVVRGEALAAVALLRAPESKGRFETEDEDVARRLVDKMSAAVEQAL